jgi:Ni2+-binding GTPase involved in maturation of urease and hydrogenase
MLKFADIVVVTKGDIVSQAEREVFSFNIRQVNSGAYIIFVNGITGQGSFMLSKKIAASEDVNSFIGKRLRFTTPAATCSYCTGETRVGQNYQMGMMRKMEFEQ